MFSRLPDVTFKSPAVVLDAPTITASVLLFGSIVTLLVPALTAPSIDTVLAVIDIALFVLLTVPLDTVTAPVPLVINVTPVAPDALLLNVILPLFAFVVSASAPLAVTTPFVVIDWSLLTVKFAPVLAPIDNPAPAPLLVTVTLPLVFAVRFVVLVNNVPIAPLPDDSVTVPAVTVLLPLSVIVPAPLAANVTVPPVTEPVDIFALTAIPAPVPAVNVTAPELPPVIVCATVIEPPLPAVSVNTNVDPVDAPAIVTALVSLK
jgi:hypothetical protein